MRGIGMAFTVAALAALLVFAGFMMVRLMNAPNPSSTPTALSKPDFQAYYDARVNMSAITPKWETAAGNEHRPFRRLHFHPGYRKRALWPDH